MPIAGIVGENVKSGSFDFCVLDYFVAGRYYYLADPTFDSMQEDYSSQLGKLVAVNYAVINTSPQTIRTNPVGQHHARAGDKVEVYEEAEDVAPRASCGKFGRRVGRDGLGLLLPFSSLLYASLLLLFLDRRARLPTSIENREGRHQQDTNRHASSPSRYPSTWYTFRPSAPVLTGQDRPEVGLLQRVL